MKLTLVDPHGVRTEVIQLLEEEEIIVTNPDGTKIVVVTCLDNDHAQVAFFSPDAPGGEEIHDLEKVWRSS